MAAMLLLCFAPSSRETGEGLGVRALLLFGIPPYALMARGRGWAALRFSRDALPSVFGIAPRLLMFRVAPPRAPHFSLLPERRPVQRKVSKRNTPRHPALPAAGYVTRSAPYHAIIAPGARPDAAH